MINDDLLVAKKNLSPNLFINQLNWEKGNEHKRSLFTATLRGGLSFLSYSHSELEGSMMHSQKEKAEKNDEMTDKRMQLCR